MLLKHTLLSVVYVCVCTLAGTLGDATLSQHAARECSTWPDSLVNEHPAVEQFCSRQLGSECYIITLPCSLSQTSECTTEIGVIRLHLEIDNRGK